MNSSLINFPDISFIDNIELSEVIEKMIYDYQTKLSELNGGTIITLASADPFRAIIYACAMQIYQGMLCVDNAGKQSFLKYSTDSYLDNLGALRGISRIAASNAVTILRFSILSAITSAISIPAGTRVTNGNEVYFATESAVEIAAGSTHVDVKAICTEAGTRGNGFAPGEITILVDQIAYISDVRNTSLTEGGGDVETDADLAERIYIASSSFSVAGPADAYVYWTKTVNSNISDVSVTSSSPCVVDIRFILQGGVLPGAALIAEVAEKLRDDAIRPLTDQVNVAAPIKVTYNIEATYYVNDTDSAAVSSIKELVNKAVTEYITWQQGKIGRDINPSNLISRMIVAGAKRVVITSPVDKVVKDIEIANIGNVNIVYGGIEND